MCSWSVCSWSGCTCSLSKGVAGVRVAEVCVAGVAGVCSGIKSEQDGKGRRWNDVSGSLPSLHIILLKTLLSFWDYFFHAS